MQTMNYLPKEVVWMSRELAILKSTSSTGTMDGATIMVLEEILTTIDGIVRILPY